MGRGPGKHQPQATRVCPNGLIQEAIVRGEVTVIGCKLHSNIRPREPEPAAPISHVSSGMSAGDTAAPWQEEERSVLLSRGGICTSNTRAITIHHPLVGTYGNDRS